MIQDFDKATLPDIYGGDFAVREMSGKFPNFTYCQICHERQLPIVMNGLNHHNQITLNATILEQLI